MFSSVPGIEINLTVKRNIRGNIIIFGFSLKLIVMWLFKKISPCDKQAKDYHLLCCSLAILILLTPPKFEEEQVGL